MAGYCAIYLFAVEYIPTERSKGDFLLFRRRDIKSKKHSLDEEGNASFLSVVEPKRKDSAYDSPSETSSDFNFNRDVTQQNSVFHWSDVSYVIKEKKNQTRTILDGIDGWVKPGTLTALMVRIMAVLVLSSP